VTHSIGNLIDFAGVRGLSIGIGATTGERTHRLTDLRINDGKQVEWKTPLTEGIASLPEALERAWDYLMTRPEGTLA
jgi:hypothetical protein